MALQVEKRPTIANSGVGQRAANGGAGQRVVNSGSVG